MSVSSPARHATKAQIDDIGAIARGKMPDRFFAFGDHIVKEALRAGAVDVLIVPDQQAAVPYGFGGTVLLMPAAAIGKLSRLKTPPLRGAVACVGAKPKLSLSAARRVVVLTGVQDPVNVGAIARTAHCLGVDGVALVASSCDPFNQKALSASQGATFHMPVESFKSVQDFRQRVALPLVAADARGGVDPLSLGGMERYALALGSEGAGLDDSVRRSADALVSVPLASSFDSLNVAAAAAIVIYALAQRK